MPSSSEIRYSQTLGRFTVYYPPMMLYYVMLANVMVALIVAYKIRRSKLGMGLLSIKNDEYASEALGVPTVPYKLLAFGVTAALMGSTGAVMASRVGYIDPTFAFSPTLSLYVLVMGFLGGPGRLSGGVLSATTLSLGFELFLARGEPYPFGVLLSIFLITSIVFKGRIQQILRMLRVAS